MKIVFIVNREESDFSKLEKRRRVRSVSDQIMEVSIGASPLKIIVLLMESERRRLFQELHKKMVCLRG